VVILRMGRITTMDATGASLLGEAIEHLERRGIAVLISGITDEHHELLATLGVAQALRDHGRVFGDTPSAIACARALIGKAAPATLQAA
jgi:SulP family sulfate permease